MKNYVKMRHIMIFMTLLLCISFGQAAVADVAPGDVIDKSTWQKLEGLLPKEMIDLVEQGKLTDLKIGTLSYDPYEYLPAQVTKNHESNKDRYDVDKDGLLVDRKTGKYPNDLEGIPFPGVNENTPEAGIKIAHNLRFFRQSIGHINFQSQLLWVGPKGLERSVDALYYEFKYTSNPQTAGLQNRKNVQRLNITKITAPFDVAGTAIMLWSYEGPTLDNTYAYVPSIRRVRRTSPASRSDAMFGSDFAIDDAAMYDGKIAAMKWTLLEKGEGLIGFVDKHPFRAATTMDGSIMTPKDHPAVQYGFEVEGWKGAPWAPTNLTWVKRKVYVVEANHKNRYYNYGKQVF
ncbi:MAG: DUF1329 domain-containing protein, partial [Deltaproteobacteria bacterium]|nr:DUF1329 domain-containing protein [Deltaproteobacteria bacterium]